MGKGDGMELSNAFKGSIAMKLGKLEEAMRELERAHGLMSDHVLTLNICGDTVAKGHDIIMGKLAETLHDCLEP